MNSVNFEGWGSNPQWKIDDLNNLRRGALTGIFRRWLPHLERLVVESQLEVPKLILLVDVSHLTIIDVIKGKIQTPRNGIDKPVNGLRKPKGIQGN